MSNFQWNDGVIYIARPNMTTRMKNRVLNRLVNVWNIQDPIEKELTTEATWFLSCVEQVEGNVGVDIPNGNATQENVTAFIDWFRNEDIDLHDKWTKAISDARITGNDPELLPPQEIDPND